MVRFIFIYRKWLSLLTSVSSSTQCMPTTFSKKLYSSLCQQSIVFKSLELHSLLFSFVRGADPFFPPPALSRVFSSSHPYSSALPLVFSRLLVLIRPLCLASSLLPYLTSSFRVSPTLFIRSSVHAPAPCGSMESSSQTGSSYK